MPYRHTVWIYRVLFPALNVKKLLSLWGLKWNPFSPELPSEALRVTIPLRSGVDTLNVGVAAGIFLYHFSRRSCS